MFATKIKTRTTDKRRRQGGRPIDLQRAAERALKRGTRRAATTIFVPGPPDAKGRKARERNPGRWLRAYFPDLFWYEWTLQQREMIAAIAAAIATGGDQAIAASRGEGKTKIAERLLLFFALTGRIKLSVLFAATGPAAQDSLRSLMAEIEENPRLKADYPEVCAPVAALEGIPQRAHSMTARGIRADDGRPFDPCQIAFQWCGDELVLPNVPGSRAARAIIATRGLDAAVRGLSKLNRRVDLAIIDDPDTEETARSEDQAAKLETRIDRAIAGLGGQRRTVARVMLTTLQSRISVSYRYTDPAQKPAWKGRRFRFLLTPPARLDLWDEYMTRRASDWTAEGRGEPTTTAADFYAANRADMDAGAAVANPHRHTPAQLSALQFYYDQIARTSAEAVATEYDNDPPETAGPIESGITARRVQTQVSGYPRRTVPPGLGIVTQGVDVGKFALHWTVIAWAPDATGFVIDYGVQEVIGTTRGSDEAVDAAIGRALYARRETGIQNPYTDPDGRPIDVGLTLVDAGYRTDAIYRYCREVGLAWRPAMGFGQSSGAVRSPFRAPLKASADRRPGDRWFLSRRGPTWLVCMDADHWKAWLHDRIMTPPGTAGCLTLFGEPGRGDRLSDDQKGHFSFSKHLTAEVEAEEVAKNRGLVRKWRVRSETNHWFDAAYMAAVGGSMLGVSPTAGRTATPAKPLKLSELQRTKREARL